MKVVILADSLALPRPPEAGNIVYEQTYPYIVDVMLRDAFPERMPVVIERGQRFRTIGNVLEDWKEIVEYRAPDFIVVHVGIVDCAPRIFSKEQRYFIEHALPRFFRDALLRFVHRYRKFFIKHRSSVTYTPLAEFSTAISELVMRSKRSAAKKLLLINILTPSAELEARSPGYTDQVRAYNEVLQNACAAADEKVELVDFNGLVQAQGGIAELTVDGMHPNVRGNRLLAQALVEKITRSFKEQKYE